jgi:hypothetical protein
MVVPRPEEDHFPVVGQHGRADLMHYRIDEHDWRLAFVLPGIRGHAVAFASVRLPALGGDDRLIGQQDPSLLVRSDRLAGSRLPCAGDRVVDDALRVGEGSDHQPAIRQDAARRIADDRPGRWRNRGPGIRDGIVDLAPVRVSTSSALFAADHDHPAVPERARRVIAAPDAHVRDRGPRAVHIAAGFVRDQYVPVRRGLFLYHHPPVRKQDHCAGVEWRLVDQSLPSSCHGCPPHLWMPCRAHRRSTTRRGSLRRPRCCGHRLTYLRPHPNRDESEGLNTLLRPPLGPTSSALAQHLGIREPSGQLTGSDAGHNPRAISVPG